MPIFILNRIHVRLLRVDCSIETIEVGGEEREPFTCDYNHISAKYILMFYTLLTIRDVSHYAIPRRNKDMMDRSIFLSQLTRNRYV
jgi:hypothetical protein